LISVEFGSVFTVPKNSSKSEGSGVFCELIFTVKLDLED
jgi:hypothetical protein